MKTPPFMRISLIPILFFSTAFMSFSQKDDKIYFDEDWEKCKQEFASYYRIVVKSKDGYLASDYYMNGQVQMKGRFADKKCEVYDGQFEWFDSSGNVYQSYFYENDYLVGNAIDYYPNGQIKIKDPYKDGDRDGVYEEFYPNGDLRARANFSGGILYGPAIRYFENKSEALIMKIDSLGNGDLMAFYSNGNERILGDLKNGYQIGEWNYYDENGKLTKSEVKNQEEDRRKVQTDLHGLKPGEPMDSKNKELNNLFFYGYGFDYDPVEGVVEFPEVEAEFVGGFTEMAKYIQKTVNYPIAALMRNKQGKVYVKFVVEKDGSISHVRVVKGPQLLRGEAVRVIENMPNWIPGKIQGEPVRCWFQLPINFALE